MPAGSGSLNVTMEKEARTFWVLRDAIGGKEAV